MNLCVYVPIVEFLGSFDPELTVPFRRDYLYPERAMSAVLVTADMNAPRLIANAGDFWFVGDFNHRDVRRPQLDDGF